MTKSMTDEWAADAKRHIAALEERDREALRLVIKEAKEEERKRCIGLLNNAALSPAYETDFDAGLDCAIAILRGEDHG